MNNIMETVTFFCLFLSPAGFVGEADDVEDTGTLPTTSLDKKKSYKDRKIMFDG